MLSILITIYNFNLLSLVKELHRQCLDLQIEFEILTQDDASNSIFNVENEKINLLSNCSFISLVQNIGLRQNKNLLVEKSKFENLLIIDGDCLIISSNYIKNYLNSIEEGFEVVYGGRVHPKKCPAGNKKLRWKYGLFIEDKLVINRQKKPYQSLIFNNTLIKKKCFSSVKFDSILDTYGHDDTLFSFELMKLKTTIKHIENPIEHNDIDTNLIFINKTKNALKNLSFLYQSNQIDKSYFRLIYFLDFLKKYKISFMLSSIYLFFESKILKNLEGSNPSLFVFNFFRVGYLCTLKN